MAMSALMCLLTIIPDLLLHKQGKQPCFGKPRNELRIQSQTYPLPLSKEESRTSEGLVWGFFKHEKSTLPASVKLTFQDTVWVLWRKEWQPFRHLARKWVIQSPRPSPARGNPWRGFLWDFIALHLHCPCWSWHCGLTQQNFSETRLPPARVFTSWTLSECHPRWQAQF